MKGRLAASHRQIALARKEALAAQTKAREAVEAKKRELDEMVRAMNAQLAPLQKQMERLQDGIFAFNLYLGRDEEVIPVVEGERAPANTVVTLRQMTLNMDEESALNADTDGIDFRDITLFVDWLRADQAHIDQLIPETKAVVALRPRREAAKKYSNYEAERADENWDTFWLIRNGGCLWLTTTPFQVGERMIPTANEFTRMFLTTDREGRTVSLAPGSPAWLRAEETADLTTRHYMKVALILQGLVDRTKVFHPLPAGGLSFIEQRFYDDGTVQVISDAELALTSGRPSFQEWLQDSHAKLQTGMRVVGAFTGYGRGFHMHSSRKDYIRSNVTPEGHRPVDGVYTVKAINDPDFDFSFAFDRTDRIWDEGAWTERRAKTKANAKFSKGDTFIVPIDTVTVEDIQYYLGARSERHAYADMFPLLQAALAFKSREQQEEAPFRAALIAQLMMASGTVNPDQEADDLIAWYKTANRWHRALTADNTKASRLILAELRRRRTGVDKDETAAQAIRAAFPDAMLVARRTSDYVALIPEHRAYPAPAVAQNVYATMLVLTADGTVKERRGWLVPSKSQVAKWTVLHADECWAGWEVGANPRTHLTDDDLDQLISFVQAHAGDSRPFLIRVSEKTDSRDELRAKVDMIVGKALHAASVNVTKTGSGTSFEMGYRVKDSNSRGEPAWEIRWSGGIAPDKVVWRDEKVEQDARHLVAAIADRQRKQRAIADQTWLITRSIQEAWSAAEWEKLRLRYVDDFGDDDLWEEHKKTIRAPRYPHSDHPRNSRNGSRLYEVVEALITAGVPPYGLTVAEAAAKFDELGLPEPKRAWHVTEPPTLAEDVLRLRFREE